MKCLSCGSDMRTIPAAADLCSECKMNFACKKARITAAREVERIKAREFHNAIHDEMYGVAKAAYKKACSDTDMAEEAYEQLFHKTIGD